MDNISSLYLSKFGFLEKHVDLTSYTGFRTKSYASAMFIPSGVEGLCFLIRNKSDFECITTIGAGYNLLIRDGGIKGLTMSLGNNFGKISFRRSENFTDIDVGASVKSCEFASECQKQGLSGAEFLSVIPGTIGGALYMNAGCFGAEISQIVLNVHLVTDEGKTYTISADDIKYGYRSSSIPSDWIIVGATFRCTSSSIESVSHTVKKLREKKLSTQPTCGLSCGSVFKNPTRHCAWKIIDELGFRGASLGGAKVSEKHSNFLVNTGKAKASDIEQLGEKIRKEAASRLGIHLEWEIQRLGEF
ncbi:UDP-N-acetylmuramate dehydrogenase [Candidatus Hydrogenosomobacter endosymbioticus]|uniref:UDP-N-acetylenolpyruvoylglucosamine reductase n=1 Tax=Candidatus Hydrogenosomobacter endosymbioticus TaxID=2558174 RepID=A0ABM7V8A9_9PROT|nr:UDP-N-acetylmuramate dehydrogenase [Candidatus Hydrogenosomobacter endosymbioticus]BDB95978.1 UDP-N-acetylenolpyruvoylglucosamine reductase [Candidatus Hydrogenosomobacter endosymbioticus]